MTDHCSFYSINASVIRQEDIKVGGGGGVGGGGVGAPRQSPIGNFYYGLRPLRNFLNVSFIFIQHFTTFTSITEF